MSCYSHANVGRGQWELVGVKTGYDIVCVKCRKGPAGAGRCEDGVCYCVLNVGRGQRELVGVKTGYDIVC